MNKKKMKRILCRKANFVTKPIKNYVSNEAVHRINCYVNYYEELSIMPKTILFESRDGQSFTGNSYALYREILNDDRFSDYQFYWSYANEDDLNNLIRNFNHVERTIFVKRNSDQYLRLLASVNYLVNNSTFQNFYIKKDGQVYINTWHGTPLKTMGFDIPDDPCASQNVLRNFLMTDYLLSPNAQTTKMYLNSYKLDGLYDGKVLESGYPRIDLMINANQAEIYAKLSLAGITLDYNKPTILYTPTWKGKDLKKPTLDIEQMLAEMTYIHEHLGNEYNLLVKVHPYAYKLVKDREELQGILVPDYYDANEIMAITNILITDYSSIFFDYLITDKPIIFYSWDKELYQGQRGMYFTEEELPGPVLSTVEEVVEAVQHIDDVKKTYTIQYNKMKQEMCAYEDGQATKRYINRIFFEHYEDVYEPVICHDKKRIIIFPGLLKNNGITMSAINLLNNIDYDKYDVTVFSSKAKSALEKLPSINKNARIIFKFGYSAYNVMETYLDELIRNRSVTDQLEAYYPEKAYVRDSRRLSGGAHFDVAIDFSGYAYRWSKYILSMDADRKLVYQHNDLWAEMKAKREHFINLRGIFTLYKKYDAILGVSPSNSAVNRAKLREYADADKFQYCVNSIDIDRILERKEEVVEEEGHEVKECSFKAYVHTSGDYDVITDFDKENAIRRYHFEKDQMFEVTMSMTYNNHRYFKVLFNHIYIGWLPASVLHKKPTQSEEEKQFTVSQIQPCNDIVNVSNYENTGVYRSAYDAVFKENEKYTSYWLKDVALTVKETATFVYEEPMSQDEMSDDDACDSSKEAQMIEVGTYAHIYLDDCDLGWMDQTKLVVSDHDIEAKHEFICQLVDVKQSVGFYRLPKEQEMTVYSDVDALQLHDAMTVTLPAAVLKKLNTLETENDTYIHVMLEDGRDFWTLQQQFDETDSVCKLVTPMDNHKTYQFTKRYVPLYPSVDCYLAQFDQTDLEDYKQKVDRDVMVTAMEMVTTSKGILYHIEYATQHYYVTQDMLKVSDDNDTLYDINGNEIPAIEKENYNLVTMGRLSEEKNQEALIESIALLLAQHPSWRQTFRLYMLGDGRLRKRLLAKIKKLDLEGNIFLLGQQSNPFAIMKQCDCFILPSLYEGQPMVLLEALTLGMDTMATDITSNRYVLEDGKYGLLIPNTSSKAIANSISQYYTEKPTFAHFDYELYNQKAMQNFYDKLQGDHQ